MLVDMCSFLQRRQRSGYTQSVNLFKAASLVSVLTLASRITGLMRELLVAAFFGASATTDAFNVAFRIPNLLRRLFAEGAFSQAFVPVLAATRATHGDEATKTLVDSVATVMMWALLLTCVVGVLGAPWVVWLMASGLQQSGGDFDTAVVLTQWMFPYIGFMSMVALAAGVLNTWKKFVVPAATPVLLNVAMIGAAAWGAPYLSDVGIEPIYAMAGGVMLGGMLQLGVQVPALLRIGMLPTIGLRPTAVAQAWRDPGTRRILRLMGPALLGVSVAQISLLINTQIASHLTPGSVSWLTYADRLMEFPTALLGVALGVVLLPQLSASSARDDDAAYSGLLDWGLRLVVLLTVPCALALLLMPQPLVSVLYHYGRFNDGDLYQTSLALMGYGVGLVGLVAIKILAPGYYAKQDIKTPVTIAVVVLVFIQLLNVVLVPHFAHAGLALAIGLGAVLNASWLWIGLVRKGTLKPLPGWGLFVLRIALVSVVLSAWMWWSAQAIDWAAWHSQWALRIVALAGVFLVCVVIYFGGLAALGMPLKQLMRRNSVLTHLETDSARRDNA
jgi:putative peptidoglycan lipid II flippase